MSNSTMFTCEVRREGEWLVFYVNGKEFARLSQEAETKVKDFGFDVVNVVWGILGFRGEDDDSDD